MAKSFLVIGLGRFGNTVAATLSGMRNEVMAVDQSMENVENIKGIVLNAAQCDTTDEHAIEALGVNEFDAVIICIGSDIRASVMTTLLCLEHGAKFVIAKAQDELHAKLLKKVGAHKVVHPEKDAGIRLARSLSAENMVDFLSLSDTFGITEQRIPQKWIGKSLLDVNVRQKFDVSVIAIRRGGHMVANPKSDTRFEEDDTLLLIGENEALTRVARIL